MELSSNLRNALVLLVVISMVGRSNCQEENGISEFLALVGKSAVNKILQNIEWSNTSKYIHNGFVARGYSHKEMDTIVYDIVRAIGVPVVLGISAYAAYIILRSVLSPVLNGLDMMVLMPMPPTTIGGGNGGIPTVGRIRRGAMDVARSSEELLRILSILERAEEKLF